MAIKMKQKLNKQEYIKLEKCIEDDIQSKMKTSNRMGKYFHIAEKIRV